MHILVYHYEKGEMKRIEIESSEVSIKEVKQRIYKETGVPEHIQILTYKESVDETHLNDFHTVGDYDIRDNKIVTLTEFKYLQNYFTRNIFMVFACGIAFGVGHSFMVKFIKTYFTDIFAFIKRH